MSKTIIINGTEVKAIPCESCKTFATDEEIMAVYSNHVDHCVYCGDVIAPTRMEIAHQEIDGKHKAVWDVEGEVFDEDKGITCLEADTEKRAGWVHDSCLKLALPHWDKYSFRSSRT